MIKLQFFACLPFQIIISQYSRTKLDITCHLHVSGKQHILIGKEQLGHFFFAGSISKIGDDADYKCRDGSSPEIRHKAISGVVGAASSVTSIQVANLLKLFKIPMVTIETLNCHNLTKGHFYK